MGSQKFLVVWCLYFISSIQRPSLNTFIVFNPLKSFSIISIPFTEQLAILLIQLYLTDFFYSDQSQLFFVSSKGFLIIRLKDLLLLLVGKLGSIRLDPIPEIYESLLKLILSAVVCFTIVISRVWSASKSCSVTIYLLFYWLTTSIASSIYFFKRLLYVHVIKQKTLNTITRKVKNIPIDSRRIIICR